MYVCACVYVCVCMSVRVCASVCGNVRMSSVLNRFCDVFRVKDACSRNCNNNDNCREPSRLCLVNMLVIISCYSAPPHPRRPAVGVAVLRCNHILLARRILLHLSGSFCKNGTGCDRSRF